MQLFRVRARITFVNDTNMDVPFNVRALSEADVKKRVTPEYIMSNVSDDWGVPIRSVTVLKVQAVGRARL